MRYASSASILVWPSSSERACSSVLGTSLHSKAPGCGLYPRISFLALFTNCLEGAFSEVRHSPGPTLMSIPGGEQLPSGIIWIPYFPIELPLYEVLGRSSAIVCY
jgi:hypothetical protein